MKIWIISILDNEQEPDPLFATLNEEFAMELIDSDAVKSMQISVTEIPLADRAIEDKKNDA